MPFEKYAAAASSLKKPSSVARALDAGATYVERVDRLVHGNPGRVRRLTRGVSEMKIDTGPGYRVYFTERAGELIVLLAGGDKSSQQRDIRVAIELAENL